MNEMEILVKTLKPFLKNAIPKAEPETPLEHAMVDIINLFLMPELEDIPKNLVITMIRSDPDNAKKALQRMVDIATQLDGIQ